jgi:hypothetical protein
MVEVEGCDESVLGDVVDCAKYMWGSGQFCEGRCWSLRALEMGAKLEGASRNLYGGTLRIIYGGLLRFVKALR